MDCEYGGDGHDERNSGVWGKPLILMGSVLALFVAAIVFDIPQVLDDMKDWIGSLGPWAPVTFIGVYVLATIFAVPGTPLTAAAGALFGALQGVAYVSVASTVGASLCFLIARYIARDAVARWVQDKPKFQKLDRLTLRQGAVVVAVTRLVPLFPFNLLNYGFGLTRVRFWQYVLVSWICMLPGTVLYVVGVAAITEGVRKGEVPWALVGVVVFTVVALTMIVRRARAMLKDAEGAAEDDGDV